MTTTGSTAEKWEQIYGRVNELATNISAKQEAINDIRSTLDNLNTELNTERQAIKQLSNLIHDSLGRKSASDNMRSRKANNNKSFSSPDYDEIKAMHDEWAEEDRIAKEDEYRREAMDPAQADYEFDNLDENRTPGGWPDTFYDY